MNTIISTNTQSVGQIYNIYMEISFRTTNYLPRQIKASVLHFLSVTIYLFLKKINIALSVKQLFLLPLNGILPPLHLIFIKDTYLYIYIYNKYSSTS